MTAPRANIVTAGLELDLMVPGGPSLPVEATLRYESDDPYAVHVAFNTGGDEVVEWTFARQLLTDGVTHSVGDGDVQVWPARGGQRQLVCVSLSSPSGTALFEAPLGRLVEFLTRTYTAVPTGCEGEYVDLDAELALLLWAGAGD